METQREIYLDPEAARQAYATQFAEHRDQLQTICDSLGVEIYETRTDQALDDALFHVVSTHRRRSGGPARAGMLSSAGQGGGAGR